MKEKGMDIRKNKKAMRRLRTECESKKVDLSVNNNVQLFVDYLMGDEDFEFTLNKETFENIIMSTIERLLSLVQKVLEDSGFTKTDINDVILTGGSSRIPKIKEIFSEFFKPNNTNIKTIFNPDEAVGYGVTLSTA